MHFDSALCLLNRASKIDKNYYVSYSNKVTIYCIKQDYEEALIELWYVISFDNMIFMHCMPPMGIR